MTAPGGTAPPVAPAQGIAITPIALTAGAPVTIPFPAQANQPQAWRTPWLVILNSSPFSLTVNTGTTTTQIAAFTSDKVFVFAVGPSLAVTVTPTSPSGTVAAGFDQTLYATWYGDEPPGTYPAALGSGAVSLATVSTFIPQQNFGPIASPGSILFGGVGGTDVGSTLGLSLSIFCTSGGPSLVYVTWFDSGGTFVIAQRKIILGDGTLSRGNQVQVSFPHLGARVTVQIQNNSGVNVSGQIGAVFTRVARQGFETHGTTGSPDFGESYVMNFGGLFSPSPNNVFPMGRNIYGGPAVLSFNAGGALDWQFLLESTDNLGNFGGIFATILTLSNDNGNYPNNGFSVPILLPATYFRGRFIYNGAVNVNAQASIIADDWRNP